MTQTPACFVPGQRYERYRAETYEGVFTFLGWDASGDLLFQGSAVRSKLDPRSIDAFIFRKVGS